MNLRNISLFTLVLFLSACTSIVISNDKQVVVRSEMMDVAKAQQLAEVECAKRSLKAYLTQRATYWDRTYVFDCVR